VGCGGCEDGCEDRLGWSGVGVCVCVAWALGLGKGEGGTVYSTGLALAGEVRGDRRPVNVLGWKSIYTGRFSLFFFLFFFGHERCCRLD
jgi:hypothetical protein